MIRVAITKCFVVFRPERRVYLAETYYSHQNLRNRLQIRRLHSRTGTSRITHVVVYATFAPSSYSAGTALCTALCTGSLSSAEAWIFILTRCGIFSPAPSLLTGMNPVSVDWKYIPMCGASPCVYKCSS